MIFMLSIEEEDIENEHEEVVKDNSHQNNDPETDEADYCQNQVCRSESTSHREQAGHYKLTSSSVAGSSKTRSQ